MIGSFKTYRNTVELPVKKIYTLWLFLLIEISATELRASNRDSAISAVSYEYRALDRPNVESGVLAVVNRDLQQRRYTYCER